MKYNMDDIIDTLTPMEMVEFLNKLPLQINVDVNAKATFFGNIKGDVKVELIYKGNVLQQRTEKI